MSVSIRALLGYLLAILVMVSGHIGQASAQTTVASYAGAYGGTYSGIDQGTWTATISSSGVIVLAGTSVTGETFRGDSSVSSNGAFAPVGNSTTTGSRFSGTINATTGDLSGTWINVAAGAGGNFSGTRTGSSTTTTAPLTSTTTSVTTTTTTASITTTTLAALGTFDLAAGWNLLGHGGDAPLGVATGFGDPSKVSTVWRWVAATGKWAFYTPALDQAGLATYAAGKGYDVLTTIYPGDGFWVNAKIPYAITYTMGQPFRLGASSLVTGWNLVGNGDKMLPSELDSFLGGTASSPSFTSMWAWNSSGGNWHFYAPTLASNGTLANYVQGKGYLDFGVLGTGNGVGFWVNSLVSDPSGKGIRPQIGWEVSVSPGIYTYVMQLCYVGSGRCTPLGGAILMDVNQNDTITVSGFANGISFGNVTRAELQKAIDVGTNALNTVLTNIWKGTTTPSAAVIQSVFNTALANATSPEDVVARVTSGFVASGFQVAAGNTAAPTVTCISPQVPQDGECVTETPMPIEPVYGYIEITTPATHSTSDICTSWQVIGAPVRFSTCAYKGGTSGYLVVENDNSSAADICWAISFNSGRPKDKGCYLGMPSGEVSKSSCFSCGTASGGASLVELTVFRPK